MVSFSSEVDAAEKSKSNLRAFNSLDRDVEEEELFEEEVEVEEDELFIEEEVIDEEDEDFIEEEVISDSDYSEEVIEEIETILEEENDIGILKCRRLSPGGFKEAKWKNSYSIEEIVEETETEDEDEEEHSFVPSTQTPTTGDFHATEDGAYSKYENDVDIEFLIEENNGIELASHPKMDRITVASRPFDTLYEAVLREKPALISRSEDYTVDLSYYTDFLEQFNNASMEVQLGILDLFGQPVESAMGQTLAEPAEILAAMDIFADYDFTSIHKLLIKFVSNSYTYKDAECALPLFGSKIQHSCHPNLGYTSFTDDGCVEHRVIRPIKKGDIACVSYLSGVYELPTPQRRLQLLESKSFVCDCSRCKGLDYCRLIQCPDCCEENVPCSYDKDDNASWYCPACCTTLDADVMLSKEKSVEGTLKLMTRHIEMGDCHQILEEYTPEVMEEMVEEAASTLSSVHYLTKQAQAVLLDVCKTHILIRQEKLQAEGIDASNCGEHESILPLITKSVATSLQMTIASEYVANNCTSDCPSQTGCVSKYEPLYDRATAMYEACEDLMKIPKHAWPSNAIAMAEKYLPVLKAKFGNKEKKILQFEETIQQHRAQEKNEEKNEKGCFWNYFLGSR